MQITLHGYSTALFSTWYFVEELGILFDAGDGLSAGLTQKCGKIKNVFISHADRDHLTGLFQFNQLNARDGFPVIHFPEDCGSFPALEEFTKKFDPHVSGTVWKKIEHGTQIQINENILVEAVRNEHVKAGEGIFKSLSYKIVEVKKKLKPELASLPQEEIKKIIQEQGKEKTLVEVKNTLLSYSGDTPVENDGRWNGSEILIHEATFLGGEEDSKIQTHGNRHSTLEDVMKMVSESDVKNLVLGHFSSRYKAEEIDERIKVLCKKYALKIPVRRIHPGKVLFNILQQDPIN